MTGEEVAGFLGSELAGLLTDTVCIGVSAYFTAGAGLAVATPLCAAAGEAVSLGVEAAAS